MGFFKRKEKKEDNEPVTVAIISNPVSSEIFQDILKNNGIPCICHNEGAGASLKLLLGPAAAPDYILVSPENFETARELYEAYLLTEQESESEEIFEENEEQ